MGAPPLFVRPTNGQPIADARYEITRADGRVEAGVTDAEGRAQSITSAQFESLDVRFTPPGNLNEHAQAMPPPVISCSIPLLPGHGEKPVPCRLPLPGSSSSCMASTLTAKWYDAAEQGLCEGLNTRLARQEAQLALPGDGTGRLIPCAYTPELDPEGFLAPRRSADNFIQPQAHWSPVIRFRWGYKAHLDDIKDFGDSVFLNEDDYWGGGPFANGCSALADLLDRRPQRPPLPVAHRPAPQPRTRPRRFTTARTGPTTPSPRCAWPGSSSPSGTNRPTARSPWSATARATWSASPPPSWPTGSASRPTITCCATRRSASLTRTARKTGSSATPPTGAGQSGRVSHGARLDTLANFFKLLKARAGCEPPAERVDACMANPKPADGSPGFTAASDRQQWGLDGRHTHGRVTLDRNPHDQVISADSVQGIGWRGMSADEIAKTGGAGVFAQRVFAHAYPVGAAGGKDYDFWAERNKRDPDPYPGSFWIPPSPPARLCPPAGRHLQPERRRQGAQRARRPSSSSPPGRSRPGSMPTRARAGRSRSTPGAAGVLPAEARHYGEALKEFDASFDPAGKARNRNRANAPPDDPYTQHGVHRTRDGRDSDAPLGNEHTEAQLRYEHRAQLRMKARRQGKAKADGSVPGETQGGSASADYQAWRTGEIRQMLKDCVTPRHRPPSILDQPDARREGAGLRCGDRGCTLSEQDWRELRVEADWRYCSRFE